MLKAVPINLTIPSPNAPGTLIGSPANGGYQVGFDEYPIWEITARLVATPGGVLDVYLQTRDSGQTFWSDICHFTQLAAGAGTVSAFRVSFNRAIGSPATVQAINLTDNTPVLTSGQVLPWANGADVRVLIVAGAGVNASALQSITGFASLL